MNCEQEITLAEAAKLLPLKCGKRRHVKTLIRWIRHGVRGVKLAGRRLGNDWYTTPAALEQFSSDLAAKAGSSTMHVATAADTAAEAAAARAALARRGFYGRVQQQLAPKARSPLSDPRRPGNGAPD